MTGFKIMLGGIGIVLAIFGVIGLLQALHIFGATEMGSQRGLIIGLVMILIGAALGSWSVFTGLARDLAGAASVLFGVFGVIWALQGVNRFPGQSFMNGDIRWTYIGAGMIVAAIALFLYGARRPASA